MAGDFVYLQKHGEIATIFFNRPEKRNALNLDMWLSIPELMQQCEEDENVKTVIFRGVNETAFAAGADISELQALSADRDKIRHFNQATLDAEKAIMSLSKPTIALIQGYCVGGGCELAVACDLRFSDENGKFAVTPAKLGLVYNLPATKNLIDLVGPSKTKDILYSGRLLDAEEALRIGLIDRIYNSQEIVEKTYAYASMICKNAQYSVRAAKYIVGKVLEGTTENTEEITQLVLRSFETSDHQEGVQAFLEKRSPRFTYS
jgi:enoyl-CoA hydratase